MNSINRNIIERIKDSLLRVDEKGEVILFGSRARGNSHFESDWDILFLTSRNIDVHLRKAIAKNILLIELDENIVIQVLPKNKTEWETKYAITPLYKNIKKEGIAI